MKILKKTAAVCCAVACVFSLTNVYAHPGRLDKNGGHHKTADGSYHYHSGDDRTVEYSSKPSNSTNYEYSYSGNDNTSYIAEKKTPKLYASDLNMYIKGKQIPVYSYDGEISCYVIVAEDLEHYGYDINWIAEWNTLYITNNSSKYVDGMDLPNTYNGQFISDVYDSNIVIRLTFADGESYVPPSYSLNGRMIIPVDEMKCLGAFRYDSDTNTVYID